MKKLLLSVALLSAVIGYSQTYDTSGTYLINEIIPSPPNPGSTNLVNYTDNTGIPDHQFDIDETLEYFEFKGTPNATIDNDVYFIAIEGDGEKGKTDMGEVKDAFNLGGLTFGSNGILVIVADVTFATGSLAIDGTTDISGTKIINPYATALASSGANVVTVQIEGIPEFVIEESVDTLNDIDNVSITANDIGYNGTINDQSGTYMIIKSPDNDPNSANVDIDIDNDGVIDDGSEVGADQTHLSWTIYDSMSILDDDDQLTDNCSGGLCDIGEYAYGQIIFYDDALDVMTELFYDTSNGAVLVPLEDDPNYFARSSDGAGFVGGTDWSAGRINSDSQPEWAFSSTAARHIPQTLASTSLPLSTFGGVNSGQTDPTLSSNDFSIDGEAVTAFQPTSETLAINGVEVDATTVYALSGAKVATGGQTVDVSSLKTGVYIIQVEANGKSTAETIVIK